MTSKKLKSLVDTNDGEIVRYNALSNKLKEFKNFAKLNSFIKIENEIYQNTPVERFIYVPINFNKYSDSPQNIELQKLRAPNSNNYEVSFDITYPKEAAISLTGAIILGTLMYYRNEIITAYKNLFTLNRENHKKVAQIRELINSVNIIN